MKEFKGTPGPWFVSYRRDGWGVRVTNGEHQVVTFNGKRVKTAVDGICDMVAPKHASLKVADAHLIAAAPDLLEAALFADRRSKQLGEGHIEFFERLADEFYQRHGYLPPGKDDPLRSTSSEEAQEEWSRFLNEPGEARRAAIAKALGEDHE